METAHGEKFSLNDRIIEQLHLETVRWISLLFYASEEIRFLKFSLEKHIHTVTFPESINTAFSFLEILDERKFQCQELSTAIKKHQNDILGMRECEDVFCDNFYSEEHEKWHDKLQDFQLSFGKTKSDIFEFITPSEKD